MNPRPGTGEAAPQGLLTSLRNLLQTGLQMGRVRLELLGNELEEQKLRLAQGLMLAVAGLLLLLVALVLACGLILLLVQEGHRLAVMVVLILAIGVGGVALLRAGGARLRTPGGIFQATLDELARDRAALGSGPPP